MADEIKGFSEQEKADLKAALSDVQKALETKQSETIGAELKKHAEVLNEQMKKFADWQVQKDEADQANQKALDGILAQIKIFQEGKAAVSKERKSFHQALIEALADPDNQKAIERVGKGDRAKIMLKGPIDMSAGFGEVYDPSIQHKMDTKVMTTSPNITGVPQLTYSARQAVIPSQKTNFRDLIPTVHSDTGIFVHFGESAPSGPAGIQAEGAVKNSIDYNFSEVRTVNTYVSGFTRFSKQLLRNLPWLQSTLPRLLTREFFKAENRHFWDIVVTKAGVTAGVSTESLNAKRALDAVTRLFNTDYSPAALLMNYVSLNRINKELLNNGYYLGAGGVKSDVNTGGLTVMGVPIIPVTWIPSNNKMLAFDADYVERIEVESMAIEFFEQDSDNVQKNLVTARVECLEEINPMLSPAILITDFGLNSGS